MNYQKNILLFILVVITTCSSFSQDSGFDKPVKEKNRKDFSVYIEYPVFFQHWGELINTNVEVLFINRDRFFNPAVSIGFGLELSGYGLETYSIPFEFKFVMYDAKLQFETGFGLTIIDPDVAITSRFGFRTYLFRHLLVRLAYTPYFMVPYGDREYNEPYIDIKSDVSIGVGYRFGK